MDRIFSIFPKIKELLGIEKLCRHLGFEEDVTKCILDMKPVGFNGKLYSSEYERDFETDYSVAEIKPYLSDPDKLKLTIDGLDNVSWFRQKQKEFLEKIRIKIQPQQPKIKSGLKMS